MKEMEAQAVGAPSARDRAGGRFRLRSWVHVQLDPHGRPGGGLSTLNWLLVGLILAASLAGVLETEPTLTSRLGGLFTGLEVAFGGLFSLEYAARLWTAPEPPGPSPAWRKRLAFILSPAAIADLIAVVSSFLPVVGPSAVLLRGVRLARILRLAKLGRMSRAMHHIAAAISDRREELFLSFVAGLVLMVVSATALYFVEGPVQPDKFGSIPRALWWSVATLTTIGYGDVYPVTPLGKVLASLTAIFSIGLVAMPTGILAAAFSDAVQRHRQRSESGEDA
jgi:voltage-gated potassium channel